MWKASAAKNVHMTLDHFHSNVTHGGTLAQAPTVATAPTIGTSLHSQTATSLTAGVPTGPNLTAAAVVATQQANQQAAGAAFGNSLTALSIQNALQSTAVLPQPGIALPASLATTTPVVTPGIALPTTLATTLATVSYPAPRLIGQVAAAAAQFQAAAAAHQAVVLQPQPPPQQVPPKQRVFTGTVTKLHENFGFVDEDVFFQTSAVKGSIPKMGERVLVEAAYNPIMPFKWNAARIQVLPNQLVQPSNSIRPGISTVCSLVPPNIATAAASVTGVVPGIPTSVASHQNQFAVGLTVSRMANLLTSRRHSPPPPARGRERDMRREDRRERYREREYERERYSPTPQKRARSPSKTSRSPPRRRQKTIPRYNVQIPKISLDLNEGSIVELRKRYGTLYIPSDFVCANFLWQDAFPAYRPFSFEHPCSFHIMQKEVEPVQQIDAVLEPTDADYVFSAKVMLLSLPPVQDIYQKACALAEDSEETRETFVHPTRLINFLVGLKGKNETVAIGGPWSPSLDGAAPDKDPRVLIRTAIRTCRALTGIDLSKCTHWYRFAKIHYRRGESNYKGRVVPKRVETVVIFLPDIWSCIPTALEWDSLVAGYKNQLRRKREAEEAQETQEEEDAIQEEQTKKEPSHHSELDPKTMKVTDLRKELEARNMSVKGLKSQLIARLTKTLKLESEKDDQREPAPRVEPEEVADDSDAADEERKKKEEEEKKQKEIEKEKVAMEKRYQLPEEPCVLVHPSATAKGGKFDCTIMSLSVLLDYRQEDNKEHSFEVSLFAELFNEMLMRDFGFTIYKTLVDAPENKDEDKKKLDKKDEKKDRKDDKDDKKKKTDIDDSEQDEDDSLDDEDESADKKKKKKEKKVQMQTLNPHLLLSFVYFDQNHCGYILEKDLEEIMYIIGLQLSRSQVRRLLQKVVKRETLHYRKLTDKPRSEQQQQSEKKDEESTSKRKYTLEELAAGNRRYLPVFRMPSSSSSEEATTPAPADKMETSEDPPVERQCVAEPLITYKGALLDVEKLMLQLKRSETARADTESKMKEMQEELDEMQEAASISEQNAQKVSGELEVQCERLKTTEEDLRVSRIHLEKYQRGLAVCRDQLHLLLGSVETALEGVPTTLMSNTRKAHSYSSVILKSETDHGD